MDDEKASERHAPKGKRLEECYAQAKLQVGNRHLTFFYRKRWRCHITAVIDCCDRQIVGWRVSKSGKADVAAAALEDAIVRRRPKPGLRLRSDNGLVFASGKFCKTAQSAGCLQGYITPYTPEQNGMIERWFKTLKTECLWHKSFSTISFARAAIDSFVEEYNEGRPHRSLGMLTPPEWAERFVA